MDNEVSVDSEMISESPPKDSYLKATFRLLVPANVRI